ncbi:hypothetical protein [Glycomyces tarimensis]
MDTRDNADTSESATDTARREGSEVAHTAADEAKGVAGAAREQGRQLAGQAKAEARHVAEDARSQLREQASEQASKAGDSLRRLGEQVAALAEGRPQEAGPLADYAHSAAEEIQSAAGKMQQRGFEGLVEDTKRFARKRPAAFLGVAAIAGFAAGRLLRGGTEARQQQDRTEQVGGTDPRTELGPPGEDVPTGSEGTLR